MSVMVILSFCFVLELKAPAHLDCRLLRMRRRYWLVNTICTLPSAVQTWLIFCDERSIYRPVKCVWHA